MMKFIFPIGKKRKGTIKNVHIHSIVGIHSIGGSHHITGVYIFQNYLLPPGGMIFDDFWGKK